MKTYMLSVIYPADATQPSPEDLATIVRDVDAVHQELRAAGAWIFGGGLYPATTATMVQLKDGQALITDGPFAETKEQLGGLSIIKAPDLDAALGWARKMSQATTTPIEVRPFVEEAEG